MEFESNSTECYECHTPLVWVGRSTRIDQGREVYEFDFRCDTCKREYRFRDGKLEEVKVERNPVAEHMAMHKAELDTARNRRCPQCGGPLDDWLACGWCHERYSIDNGELIPKLEELLKHKPKMSDFYALQWKQ